MMGRGSSDAKRQPDISAKLGKRVALIRPSFPPPHLTCARGRWFAHSRRFGKRGATHKRKAIRMLDGVDGQINVESRPEEMIFTWSRHVRQLGDRSVLEPGELGEGYEQLSAVEKDPESVRRDVCHLNCGSAVPTLAGFHLRARERCALPPQVAHESSHGCSRPRFPRRVISPPPLCMAHMNVRARLLSREEE